MASWLRTSVRYSAALPAAGGKRITIARRRFAGIFTLAISGGAAPAGSAGAFAARSAMRPSRTVHSTGPTMFAVERRTVVKFPAAVGTWTDSWPLR